MIKHILFDFDGVILDSMPIRDAGFAKLFESYAPAHVDRLLKYHKKNGGLSRYVKIRHFFNEILNENISDYQVQTWADRFSAIVKEQLCDRSLLIKPTIDFIRSNFNWFDFHIVSGSDENELREICKAIDIKQFFRSINGSPTPKNDLVCAIIDNFGYERTKTAIVGDSTNDYEAAENNGIRFFGFNNQALKGLGELYIEDGFSDLYLLTGQNSGFL